MHHRTTWIALALVSLPRLALAQAETLKDSLKGAESVEAREVDLSVEARQKLAAALGDAFKPEADGKVFLGVAKNLPNPLEDPEKLEKALAVVAASGRARVAVTAYADAVLNNQLTVAAVKILDPADPPEAVRAFARRLAWFRLGPNAREPIAAFETLRKAAEAGADDVARQNKPLLAVARVMREMDDTVYAVKASAKAKDKEGMAGPAARLLKLYEDSSALYAQSGFVFPGMPEERRQKLENLAQMNARGIEEAKTLHAAADAKDLALVRKAVGLPSCAKCHGVFEKAFQSARTARKIGDGYCIPGHDLPPVHGADAPLAHDVAAAVRKALLLMDQADK
jgi:hypothetical protein